MEEVAQGPPPTNGTANGITTGAASGPQHHHSHNDGKHQKRHSMVSMVLMSETTEQSGWTTRPHSVDLSASLWHDLVAVGVLYRLSLFIAELAVFHGVGATYWPAVGIFFAVFDAWTTEPLYETCFQVKRQGLLKFVFTVLSWLLVAMMGVSLQVTKTPEDPLGSWSAYDAQVFGWLKFGHSLDRIAVFFNVAAWSESPAARRTAATFLTSFAPASLIYLAAPLVTILAPSPIGVNVAPVFWIVGYVAQRAIWLGMNAGRFERGGGTGLGAKARGDRVGAGSTTPTNGRKNFGVNGVRGNVPFLERRLGDWIMLQLGVGVLGLVTAYVDGSETDDFDSAASALTVLVSYVLFASLLLLHHSAQLENLTEHALNKALWREALWFELFVVQGLGLVGVAVGTRALLFLPQQVMQPVGQGVLWLLAGSTVLVCVVELIAEKIHGGLIGRVAGMKTLALKLACALCALIAPAVVFAYGEQSTSWGVFYVPMGCALATAATVVLHGLLGGFRKQAIKTRRTSLAGHVLAAVVAKIWLRKTRERLAAQRKLLPASVETGPQLPMKAIAPPASPNRPVPPPSPVNLVTTWTVSKVLNAHFYERPRGYAVGDAFAEFKVQWSDLFFDVLYIGVVYRLGDFLLMGLGYAGHLSQFDSPLLVYLFVFVTVFALWQEKLAYTSKCGVSDLFHKLVDLLQGLCVLVAGSSVANETDHTNALNPTLAFWFTSSVSLFHAIMLALWLEAYFQAPPGQSSALFCAHALANSRRCLLALLPMLLSYACIADGVDALATSALWFCSWLLPFLDRCIVRAFGPLRRVPALQGYVAHRLGDAIMIFLGEGVLQILKTTTRPNSYHYFAFVLAFLVLLAVRVAVFSMDAFHDPRKSADSRSRGGALLVLGFRSLSYPAVVSLGVSMKIMVGYAQWTYDPYPGDYYWLLCGSSALVVGLYALVYETHRFTNLRAARLSYLIAMVIACGSFLLWPWIPMPAFGILLLVLLVWLAVLVIQLSADDFLHDGEHHGWVEWFVESTRQGFERSGCCPAGLIGGASLPSPPVASSPAVMRASSVVGSQAMRRPPTTALSSRRSIARHSRHSTRLGCGEEDESLMAPTLAMEALTESADERKKLVRHLNSETRLHRAASSRTAVTSADAEVMEMPAPIEGGVPPSDLVVV